MLWYSHSQERQVQQSQWRPQIGAPQWATTEATQRQQTPSRPDSEQRWVQATSQTDQSSPAA
jgi:hypothetical protein